MRISDWSSDVCSSDLTPLNEKYRISGLPRMPAGLEKVPMQVQPISVHQAQTTACGSRRHNARASRGRNRDRKNVVEGQRVSGRVAPGGRRIIKHKEITIASGEQSHKQDKNELR